jgi:hypothetical protein
MNSLFEPPSPESLAPELVIPIGVDQKALREFLLQVMIKDDLAPDDILEASHFESEILAFYPCFISKGSFTASWTASFGYDRQEPYTAYETVYEGNRSRQVRVTRYRTVTDWRPASGQAQGNFLVAVYAGSDLPKEVASLIPRISLESMTNYQPGFVTGYDLNPVTINSEEAQSRLKPLILERVKLAVYAHAQGDRQRDWNWNSSIHNQDLKPALIPLAQGVFSYQGQNYQIWSDGVSLSLTQADKLPQDSQRSKNMRNGYAPFALSSLTTVICFFLVEDSFAFWPVLAGLTGSLLFGIIRSRSIVNHSRKVRAASLAQKKLNEGDSNQTEEERQALYKASAKPKRFFMAKTSVDVIVIPLVTLVFLLMVLVGIFYWRLGLWEY